MCIPNAQPSLLTLLFVMFKKSDVLGAGHCATITVCVHELHVNRGGAKRSSG